MTNGAAASTDTNVDTEIKDEKVATRADDEPAVGSSVNRRPFLFVHGYPVYFEEDWTVGIGGGLWSTGLALCRYLGTQHAWDTFFRYLLLMGKEEDVVVNNGSSGLNNGSRASCCRDQSSSSTADGSTAAAALPPSLSGQPTLRRLRVIELGSGNGLLSACWVALWRSIVENSDSNYAKGRDDAREAQGETNDDSSPPPFSCQLVVTDTIEHLPLLRKTLDANSHLLLSGERGGNGAAACDVRVAEYRWGTKTDSDPLFGSATAEHLNNPPPLGSKDDGFGFDIILASDVAYRPDLYEPLIDSLIKLSYPWTRIYLGVTMADTTPEFFRRLTGAGYEYRRLDDRQLEPEFRGWTFGIFAITAHSSTTTYGCRCPP
jgi:hypothetical protein